MHSLQHSRSGRDRSGCTPAPGGGSARTKTRAGGSIGTLGQAEERWTKSPMNKILPLHSCLARCRARRRVKTCRFGTGVVPASLWLQAFYRASPYRVIPLSRPPCCSPLGEPCPRSRNTLIAGDTAFALARGMGGSQTKNHPDSRSAITPPVTNVQWPPRTRRLVSHRSGSTSVSRGGSIPVSAKV